MALPALFDHLLTFGGSAAIFVASLCYGPEAVLKLVAGLTAIFGNDDDCSRTKRALQVLSALRRHRIEDEPGC